MDRRSFLIASGATLTVAAIPALPTRTLSQEVLTYPEFYNIPTKHHVAAVVGPGLAAMVDKRLLNENPHGIMYVRDPGHSPHVCMAGESSAPGRVVLGSVVGYYRVPTVAPWNLLGGE